MTDAETRKCGSGEKTTGTAAAPKSVKIETKPIRAKKPHFHKRGQLRCGLC